MNIRRVLCVAVAGLGVALIVTATLLPNAFPNTGQLPPRWCLRCGGLWLTDVISNVALFVPFGMGLALNGRRFRQALLLSFVFSALIEYSQSIGFPPARSAALSDVIANSVGGAAGALLVLYWQTLWNPSPQRSTVFAFGWAILGGVVFFGTSYAISPRTSETSDDVTYQASPFRHTPGLGWYEDVNDSAVVDSYRVTRGFTGPNIVSMSRNVDSLRVRAYVKGRDPGTVLVPIVYVHVGTDSSPVVLVGQHHVDAELRVTRRAWDFGLHFPSLRLAGAFSDRANGDGVPMELIATATPARLALAAVTPAGSDSTALRLTPTLGWTLIQSVVQSGTWLGPFAASCWLLLWTLPAGWWGGGGQGPRWVTLLVSAAILQAGAVAGTLLFHVSAVSMGQLIVLNLSVFVAGLIRRPLVARR